ncbi:hypothetical protein GCM10023075_70350 [Streptosporangium album]
MSLRELSSAPSEPCHPLGGARRWGAKSPSEGGQRPLQGVEGAVRQGDVVFDDVVAWAADAGQVDPCSLETALSAWLGSPAVAGSDAPGASCLAVPAV